MVTIQLLKGNLDVESEQALEFSWTSFRFADGLRNPYTNDFDLPKTRNNIRLLECYNLLDSPNQLFGNQIKPAVLTVDGRMTDCYLQVVSVNDDTITVCLYERTFPAELRDQNVARMFEDNDNTILAWNTNTLAAYPQWFKNYDYGMRYDKMFAQYHPVMRLDDMLPTIGQNCAMNISPIDPNLYVMATGKYLCPQCHRQTVEGLMDTSSHSFSIMGGQHVSNDLTYSVELTNNNRITFNRDCTVSMHLYIGWKARDVNSYRVPFVVNHWHAATHTNTSTNYWLEGMEYRNGVDEYTQTFTILANDHISFGVVDGQYYDMVSMVAELYITDYTVSEEDYGQDMRYVARVPRLKVWQYASATYEYWYFDATTYDIGFHRRNTGNTLHKYVDTPWTSFAWFGFFANLAEISASDLLWGIGWSIGRRPIISNGTMVYDVTDSTIQLHDAYITEIRPACEHFGRKNYIRFADDEDTEPISEIDNIWLEDEVVLHESPFAHIYNITPYLGQVRQYSNPEMDGDDYKCDFEDVGFALLKKPIIGGVTSYLNPNTLIGINLSTLWLEHITSTVEVDIESFDTPTEPTDYIYLDGRKYMTIEGSVDFQNSTSKITALLVPTI